MENFELQSDILMEIKHLNKCLKKGFDTKLASFGLTGQQGRILFCINCYYENNKEIHQSDLEDIFQLSKSSVSEIISRMVSNNLVKKIPIKHYYNLIPTDVGRAIVNNIHKGKKDVISKYA